MVIRCHLDIKLSVNTKTLTTLNVPSNNEIETIPTCLSNFYLSNLSEKEIYVVGMTQFVFVHQSTILCGQFVTVTHKNPIPL